MFRSHSANNHVTCCLQDHPLLSQVDFSLFLWKSYLCNRMFVWQIIPVLLEWLNFQHWPPWSSSSFHVLLDSLAAPEKVKVHLKWSNDCTPGHLTKRNEGISPDKDVFVNMHGFTWNSKRTGDKPSVSQQKDRQRQDGTLLTRKQGMSYWHYATTRINPQIITLRETCRRGGGENTHHRTHPRNLEGANEPAVTGSRFWLPGVRRYRKRTKESPPGIRGDLGGWRTHWLAWCYWWFHGCTQMSRYKTV